ncbi:DUF1801 domain-containing protein [Spirosoma sp. KCTC 42546]|uniref:DUF1801 domain-containing protein n=1 Tax=Spirosoma sp. KCTC 42546 TaxID=2520506 RepID=UPI001158A91C|nr:DUF1801 domain-containing protein [Spirosoma sp. KCTC 42546]QDK79263.1 DUF1801 domain-containing protein [Spirosoma sp. KCTC 42546]
MAKNKTTETENSVTDFVNSIADEGKRKDSFSVIDLIKLQTGLDPKMWGPSIVGFGSYHYIYASGHEGDAPLIGFSPRKDALTFYLSAYFTEREELLEKLGKHKTGKGCVYVKKLEDIDLDVLKELIDRSTSHIRTTYSA